MIRAPLWQVAEKGKPRLPENPECPKNSWVKRLPRAVWSPQLLALLVTSRQWNSRIHYSQVKLSQLRRPELLLWPTIPRSGSWRLTRT